MSASWPGEPAIQQDPEMESLLPAVVTYDPATPIGKAMVTVYSIAGAVVGNEDRQALIKVLVEFEHMRMLLVDQARQLEVHTTQREAVLKALDEADLLHPSLLVQQVREALLTGAAEPAAYGTEE